MIITKSMDWQSVVCSALWDESEEIKNHANRANEMFINCLCEHILFMEVSCVPMGC